MKRVFALLSAVLVLLFSSVPAFALLTPNVYGLTKEGSDIRVGTFKTSMLTAAQKEFMRTWLSDTENSFLEYHPYLQGRYYNFFTVSPDATLHIGTYTTGPHVGEQYLYLTGRYSFVQFSSFSLTTPAVINCTDADIHSGVDFRFSSDNECLLTCNRLTSAVSSYQYNFSGKTLLAMDDDLSAPSIQKHNLTINYQYANGTQAVGAYTASLDEGTSYDVPSPILIDYVPDKISIIGTMAAADVTELVTYSKSRYQLKIRYLYEDGREALPTHIKMLEKSEVYHVDTPLIAGYTASASVVSVIMPSENLNFTITYKSNSPPVSSSEPTSSSEPPVTSSEPTTSGDPALKYNLTISYLKSDGAELAGAYKSVLAEGEAYNVPSPTIGGYVPDRLSVFGTMPKRDVAEQVSYQASASGGGSIGGNPYIPWDVAQLYSAISGLRNTIGTAFDVGIWIFIMITGIYVVIKIANSFGQ